MNCVSTRSSKPLLLLMRAEHWLANWMREALDSRRDFEVTELLAATKEVRRVACELIQSDLYGGPLDPSTRKFARGMMQLMGVDAWLTRRLAEARSFGSSESTELWVVRRTIRQLLSDVIESWKSSRQGRE